MYRLFYCKSRFDYSNIKYIAANRVPVGENAEEPGQISGGGEQLTLDLGQALLESEGMSPYDMPQDEIPPWDEN